MSSDSDLSYIHLFYPQQGVCELKGVLFCSLVDLRYYPTLSSITPQPSASESDEEPVAISEYLFAQCKVSSKMGGHNKTVKDIERAYSKWREEVYQCLETSYYHIVNCLHGIWEQIGTGDSNCPLSDFPPFVLPHDQYPFDFCQVVLHRYAFPPFAFLLLFPPTQFLLFPPTSLLLFPPTQLAVPLQSRDGILHPSFVRIPAIVRHGGGHTNSLL